MPNLWQLKSDQALNTEHRDHTPGVSSPTRTPPYVFAAPAPGPAQQPQPWQAPGPAGYHDTEGEQKLHCPAPHMPLPNSADTILNLSRAEQTAENALCCLLFQHPAGHSTVPQGCTAAQSHSHCPFYDQGHTDHPGHNRGHSIHRERGDSGDGEQ